MFDDAFVALPPFFNRPGIVLTEVLFLADTARPRILNCGQIIVFLSDREVSGSQEGKSCTQSFTACGYTSHAAQNGFRPSSGRWKAENDGYCSQWPPADVRSCYDLVVDGESLAFIPDGDDKPGPAVRKPIS